MRIGKHPTFLGTPYQGVAPWATVNPPLPPEEDYSMGILRKSVLVIYNSSSPQSEYTADYYLGNRGPIAPRANKFMWSSKLGIDFGAPSYKPYNSAVESEMVNAEQYSGWGFTDFHNPSDVPREEYWEIKKQIIIDHIDTLSEKPHYVVLSKDIPLLYRYNNPLGYLVLENKLQADLLKQFGHHVSVTRLEATSLYWVLEMIDRSIASDNLDDSYLASVDYVANNITNGSPLTYAGHLDELIPCVKALNSRRQ